MQSFFYNLYQYAIVSDVKESTYINSRGKILSLPDKPGILGTLDPGEVYNIFSKFKHCFFGP